MTQEINKIKELEAQVVALRNKVHKCVNVLVRDYAENGSEAAKDVGIIAVGEREFYALLLEGGYDLNEYDREDIATLLR